MPTQNAWGLTYRPAHRKLVALASERAEQFWKRHALRVAAACPGHAGRPSTNPVSDKRDQELDKGPSLPSEQPH